MADAQKSPGCLPDHFGLPPFFTLQPVAETRAEQLVIWRTCVIAHCRAHNHASLVLAGESVGPPFENAAINRRLTFEAKRAVADALVAAGEGQWAVGAAGERLLVLWRPLSSWADELARHLRGSGSSVFTMAELKAVDGELRGCTLHGLGPDLVRAAVAELVRTGRAVTFGASAASPDDDDEVGVKLL
jgi:ESCRT-II complex subunit VPS25